HVGLAAIMLPIGYYGGYVLPRAYGLGRQSLRSWATDWLKAMLLSAALGALVGTAFVWIVIATGSSWWWIFGAFASGIGLVLVFVTPYVLVPLFFRMRPLADTDTVARIQSLVNRAGT